MGFTKPSLPTTANPSISNTNNSSSSSHKRLIILSILILFCFPLLLLTAIFPQPRLIDVIRLQTHQTLVSFPSRENRVKLPRWLEVIQGTRYVASPGEIKPLRIGLVNFQDPERFLHAGIAETLTIDFDPVSPAEVSWKKLFPEWISEGSPEGMCPQLPMPEPWKYKGLDVVVARLPCDQDEIEENDNSNNYSNSNSSSSNNNNNGRIVQWREGIRDVQRLQVSLATSRVVVENGEGGDEDGGNKEVYAVFVGKCEPMVEIFRCDDLVWREGEYWVYKPKLSKLREMINMPVGTCDLAHPYSSSTTLGSRQLQADPNQLPELQITNPTTKNHQQPREAYVTVLHSSEDYVCGAIALAQSILQTNTTKDLVLLADSTISNHSIEGLQAAGWKIKLIDRIRSPNAKADAYNEWNYSKLRVWQLTEYEKVMFIDSDFIVLRNIDHFFHYPQLSAASNDKWLFNSGIMILEPSECFFEYLMSKRYSLKSYNGGDQGYLNEVLTWWHRLTIKLNFLKYFDKEGGDRSVPKDRYTIHFLGMKPWTCYRDYDCNWDKTQYHSFASDELHSRWWEVYDAMPRKLQPYCAMKKQLDSRIRYRRGKAQEENYKDGHWKIELKDPRQYHLVSST